MRLFVVFFLFISFVFSQSPRLMALGESGGVDSNRVDSVSYFESALAYDYKEPEIYFSLSMKSSHANMLSPLNKIYTYNTQDPDIQKNYDNAKGGGVKSAGINSIQNALDAIKLLNQNRNRNMIEYVSPNFSVFYRFRNMGVGLKGTSYNYIYVHTREGQSLSYNANVSYNSLSEKYQALKGTYLNYMQRSILIKRYNISLKEFFLSYANKFIFTGNSILYGFSLKTISANYVTSSGTRLDNFNPDKIYEEVRESKTGEDKTKFSFNMSFIFIPSWTRNVKIGLAWTDVSRSKFGDFIVDSKLVFSTMYSLNEYFNTYFESDLASHQDIYNINTNKKQSFGMQFKLQDFSLFTGYQKNENIFKTGTTSFGFAIRNFTLAYKTINNFSDYYNGRLKNSAEISFSFRKES